MSAPQALRGLTPAARMWLARAAVEATVWPTYGPWQQLTEAGLLEGPQEAAKITEAGREAVR